MDQKHCHGCRNDFYNSDRGLHGKCWSLDKARMVRRYRIGTWTTPTTKGAFTEVLAPNCYHGNGVHFVERLPDFVRLEDVVRAPACQRVTNTAEKIGNDRITPAPSR
jgi:hypothetical protein